MVNIKKYIRENPEMSGRELSLLFLLFFLFGMMGFCISQMVGEVDPIFWDRNNLEIPISEAEIVERCSDLSVKKTAKCLRDNIETFYIYTITPDYIAVNMTMDDIKERGTDCSGYAALYLRLIEQLGFEVEERGWKGEADIFPGHAFTMMWDDKEHCKLDMLVVSCDERLDGKE